MKADKIIDKQNELIKEYRYFIKWVLKYDTQIMQSKRGIFYINNLTAKYNEVAKLIPEQSDEEIHPYSVRCTNCKRILEPQYWCPICDNDE